MEGIIGLVLLGAVVYGIYRMSRKREEVVESEVVAPVVDKASEEIKANIDAKTEEVFVKVMEEAAKVNKPVEEVLKEVVATVEPVAVVEEPVVAPAPAPVKQKRTRKKKAK
jgi:hypothetical protein